MFTIIENQFRPDGVINTTAVTRQTLASAKSYFYDRKSKMLMTDLYTKVCILLVDERLNPIERAEVETQYVAPVEEVVEE